LRDEVVVHGEMIPALKARNEDRAEALMQEHLEGFHAKIKAAL
jgi:DNA-binding GntR family transcriptional regulator